MVNKNRNKANQPPTGEGKKQSTSKGEPNKLNKRSEVVQAQRGRPDENIGTDAEEDAARTEAPGERNNPERQKAGR